MSTRSMIDTLEMTLYLVLFRCLSVGMGAERLLEIAGRLADRLRQPPPDRADRRGAPPWARARGAAERASRWVPGTQCLHRALASRVWLARRGIGSEVVVGFRRRDQLRGHAWLERREKTGEPTRLFFEEGEYREVFRG